ncbi:C2H2-type zinc finger family protein [Raphanus sativus]|uniref:Zinc finger protein ZAT5-like n=1 Tax=Raphanus sativus TaxID=3726 RepID=A0A6J0KAB9_RAPSA|nr:zinc finger protein ZAT5-like [Raphanus sativus]KAJ4882353.1 C2H2-type zinc finger family protein [Raphanus sativus]
MTSVHEETRLVLFVKGKRTKRQRSASPHMNTEAVSGVCSEEPSLEAREGAGEVEFQGATDEDQDMANCLMLLSQGDKAKDSGEQFSTHKIDFLRNKKPLASIGVGLEGVYLCKTCDKSFHSFQALGGHRASHKKPRLGEIALKCDEKRSSSTVETVEAAGVVGSFLSLQVTRNDGNKKQEKTHECSICKAEFSSGQALGGHMRRHRGLIVNANATSSHHQESIRPKTFLELDLNLPAPEDESKFVFASKDQILLFTATSNSLIDCHH